MDLIRSLSCISVSHLRLVRDDDSHIDRLSHRYTVAICVLFAIIVSTKQYAGDPIDCWVPAQFKASYEKYADSYCWIAGSWYTPMDKELPLNERERRQHRIRYYQWVPFLLLFQAILCYIPRIIWRSLNVRSGLDLVNLVDAAIKYESVDKFTDREKIMAYIIRNIERYIGARKSRYERLYGRQFCATHKNSTISDQSKPKISGYSDSKHQLKQNIKGRGQPGHGCCRNCWLRIRLVFSTICFWTGKRLGNYLVVLYMFVKTLWLTNAVSQLFLLNRFIGNDYHAFGIEIIEMLLSGQEWHELRHFPRVTYCDFKIREIGNSHDWTVQCVLRINLFNEVIYIFMWFWLCILALCSLVDYATWTLRLLIPGDKLRFIKRHLDIYNYYLPSQNQHTDPVFSQSLYKANKFNINDGGKQEHFNGSTRPDFEFVDVEKEKRLIRDFTFTYLKDDGVFAMRILASSASDLIVTEIISELWKNYKIAYAEVTEEVILMSSPSSTSTSSNSSQKSSAATSAASSPSSLTVTNQLAPLKPASPSNFIKKPFNYSQTTQQQHQQQHQQQQQQHQQKLQYSPSQHHMPINSPIYSNANNNQKQHNNNNNLNNNSTSMQQNKTLNRTSSPPLMNNQQQHQQQYQHQHQHQQQQQQQQQQSSSSPMSDGNNLSQPPPPPLPQSMMPQLNNIDESNKRAITNQNFRDSALYPPPPTMQQLHMHHEHSNVNPNAKDTHV